MSKVKGYTPGPVVSAVGLALAAFLLGMALLADDRSWWRIAVYSVGFVFWISSLRSAIRKPKTVRVLPLFDLPDEQTAQGKRVVRLPGGDRRGPSS